MSGRSNAGFFESVLLPLGVKEVEVPHGIARLRTSIAAHLTDLPRLHIDEEDTLNTRDTFIAAALMFAADCGRRGTDWPPVEEMIDAGCALARVELTADERRELLETWVASKPLEDAA